MSRADGGVRFGQVRDLLRGSLRRCVASLRGAVLGVGRERVARVADIGKPARITTWTRRRRIPRKYKRVCWWGFAGDRGGLGDDVWDSGGRWMERTDGGRKASVQGRVRRPLILILL